MMRNLLRHQLAQNWMFFTVAALLFGAFEYLVCAITSTVNIQGAIQEVMRSAPPFFSAMLGEQFAGLDTRGILAFGWNHPVAHAAGAALAIVMGARAIAGEIEYGAGELLMAQPFSRATYYGTYVLFGVVALAFLTLAGITGTIIGQRVFDVEQFGSAELMKLGLNYWLLQIAWLGVALMISAFSREGRRVASAAFFIALLSYLISAIGTVWTRAEPALPWSLYTYYSPRDILVQQTLKISSIGVLAIVAFAAFATGAWRFFRRDLP